MEQIPMSKPAGQLAAQEYVNVAVNELDTRFSRLRLSSPEALAALGRSIARHGVLQPLTVNQDGDGLVVLDGFKRHRVLASIADAVVPIRVVTLTQEQAKAALITFNRPHRGVSDLEEAWIVQSLVSDHQMLQKEVADLLGRHKSWVCRRLQLAQRLEGGVVEDMRLGLISATIARELVRLPRGNQAPVAAAVHRHGLTCRQTAELVARMQGAPDEVREDLLDDPLRFLTSPPATALRRTDARLSEAGDKIRRSLDALARQARMTNGVVHSPSTGVFVCSDIDLLRPQMRDVAETLHVILATLTQLIEGGDDDA